MYDIIVIGGGPAGIASAIYAVSRGKKTLVLEKDKVGGIVGKVSTVTHYPAIVSGETGKSFAGRLEHQAVEAGVELRYETVEQASLSGPVKTVKTNHGEYQTARVIIAAGSTPNCLDIPGAATLTGHGMGMNAAKDGEAYRGKHVYIIGGADGAVKEAIYMAGLASKVTIIHFEDTLGAIAEFKQKVDKTPNMELLLHTRLSAVYGDGQVERLELTDEHTGNVQVVSDSGCGIFVYTGSQPNTSIYPELTLENGYIPVNEKMETAIEGVYAAGDIRIKQVRQAATAVSDGAIAAINAAS